MARAKIWPGCLPFLGGVTELKPERPLASLHSHFLSGTYYPEGSMGLRFQFASMAIALYLFANLAKAEQAPPRARRTPSARPASRYAPQRL